MRFEIKKPVFESVLSKASSVLATKDLLPILKNFNITVEDGSCRVVATDLELSVIAHTELVNCLEEGRAVFPGKKLQDIIKDLEDAVVVVTVEEDSARIECAGYRSFINLMDADDYPEVPVVEEVEPVVVTRNVFANALMKVKGAAAKEGVRPALQMVDVSGGNVRASDGAIFRQVHVDELDDIEMQIPLGAVEDLVKLMRSTEADKMGIGQTEDHLLFIVGGDVFIVTKNNVEYPDVEGSLLGPARLNNEALTVDRAQLIAGIRRARNTADEDTKGLLLDISKDALVLKARDKYGCWSEENMDVHFDEDDRILGVNHENLIDALNAADSPSVSIMLGTDTKARKSSLYIQDGDVVAVLQQLKLDM